MPEVMGMLGGKNFSMTARCKETSSYICSLMLMSGKLGGQERVRKSEECFQRHSLAIVDMLGGALSCWSCLRLSE
ncbi:hypothetical protein TNCT_115411 [Trichonephila clavata]|uniref:Uncharacterized protein n=1 Tax=Trichonephila clavata TaxID=2740835 RepID=A0A8X6HH80_TRICU|nr:hypothetical protein TNCT_115411 [Trichonephila clavata]